MDCGPECAKCEELLQPYVDRVLTPEQRLTVQAHLDDCGYCARCYRLEERLRIHVRRCCDEQMSEELTQRLLSLRTPLL